jgi:energy-coupling factor transporter ATP-binding protein EcfA2
VVSDSSLLLAQALLGHPRLLLLDEPLISLDPHHQRAVVELTRVLQRELSIHYGIRTRVAAVKGQFSNANHRMMGSSVACPRFEPLRAAAFSPL